VYHLKFNLKSKKFNFHLKRNKGSDFKQYQDLMEKYSSCLYWAKEYPELPFEPLIDKYKNEIITLLGKHC